MNNIDNLTTIREAEFVEFLYNILSRNPHYHNVKTEVLLPDKRSRADLLATVTSKKGTSHIVIECKTRILSTNSLDSACTQAESYAKMLGNYIPIVATPIVVPSSLVNIAHKHGVSIWDAKYLYSRFEKEIKLVKESGYQNVLNLNEKNISETTKLIHELENCTPGKEQWSSYQKIVGRALEYLFVPDLKAPLPEVSDYTGANRRDYILPNYCESGFWRYARSKYIADHIVVDAKNYRKHVDKECILQMSNYLKKHGCGLFGIIFSRKGFNKSAFQTAREQWILHNKMIISVTDTDLIKMLVLKETQDKPTEVLGDIIQQFRLSF